MQAIFELKETDKPVKCDFTTRILAGIQLLLNHVLWIILTYQKYEITISIA